MTNTQILHHRTRNAIIQFTWVDGRYLHTIEWDGGRVSTPAESVDADWPESPPIQQLSIETIDQSEVALGVGCAGKSHWSVSVESTDTGFRFDWACRTGSSPKFLGSQYLGSGFDVRADPPAKSEMTELGNCIVPSNVDPNGGTHRWAYEIGLT